MIRPLSMVVCSNPGPTIELNGIDSGYLLDKRPSGKVALFTHGLAYFRTLKQEKGKNHKNEHKTRSLALQRP